MKRSSETIKIFFSFLHLAVSAYYSLKLSNKNRKKILFLMIFSCLASKIIDVRKQANVSRPSNASYSKMTSMRREFGHIIYCVRLDEESCLFRVFFSRSMYQTETGSILCAQVIVVSSDPISPFFIQEGRTKLVGNTLQCI